MFHFMFFMEYVFHGGWFFLWSMFLYGVCLSWSMSFFIVYVVYGVCFNGVCFMLYVFYGVCF